MISKYHKLSIGKFQEYINRVSWLNEWDKMRITENRLNDTVNIYQYKRCPYRTAAVESHFKTLDELLETVENPITIDESEAIINLSKIIKSKDRVTV